MNKKQHSNMVKKDKAKMKAKMEAPVFSIVAKLPAAYITKAEADKAKPHHDVLKDLKKEKNAAMKAMQKVYEADGQQACEELANEKYAHLTKWQQCSPCESDEPHIDNICCVCATKNKPLVLTITVTALTTSDFDLALDEIKKQVRSGFTEGMNKNDSGKYRFDIKE